MINSFFHRGGEEVVETGRERGTKTGNRRGEGERERDTVAGFSRY